MRRYVRACQAGGAYFITANLAERVGNRLLVDRIDDFRMALQSTKRMHPFDIVAMVVLPEHFHLLMTLPDGDANFSKRIMLIKPQSGETWAFCSGIGLTAFNNSSIN